jgi:hypothetical protein
MEMLWEWAAREREKLLVEHDSVPKGAEKMTEGGFD